ncbi:pimeloyl-ACP methyl ester carboxylesterase [Actinocorallia herbida]|uniref:Pimeloyl-ACP methyl ester carboxylesterase n=1 Tax=Actinocorallia herbida TaxID=58109 RepID=A0A3N1CVN6_9ACTN|nr:alpha/beta hydrolase [Actinocorallia herbida]ROO85362.1 pimeloyl-ACP methyl ester carboxylesterase [Actinocorallia herbida]
MRVMSDDGVQIGFEVVGEGPPVVLLHGFFGDRSTWRDAGYVAGLAGFRLVLVDGRGHGESGRPHDPGAYDVTRQGDDVLAVLDALGIAKASVWGSSMGGIVALHLLARHPARMDRVVATGAHGDAVPSQEDDDLARTLRARGVAPLIPELGDVPGWMAATMRAADPLALAALAEALPRRPSALADLAKAPNPVLLLAGEHDDDLTTIRRTADVLPHGDVAVLPGCGHFAAFTRVDLALPEVLGRGALGHPEAR